MTTPDWDHDVTELLEKVRKGESGAHDELASLVYERLHALARRSHADFPGNLTLGPTSVVNEAYLRLMQGKVAEKSPNRRYFFGAAAQAMRRVLIDHVRRRRALKRGGDIKRVPLDDLMTHYENNHIDLLALDELLTQLETIDRRKCEVVNLKLFAGLPMKEIASQLEVSLRTVETDWQTARAFLRAQWSPPAHAVAPAGGMNRNHLEKR